MRLSQFYDRNYKFHRLIQLTSGFFFIFLINFFKILFFDI